MRKKLFVLCLIVLLTTLVSCSSAPKRETDKLWIVTDLGKANAFEGTNYSIGQEGGQFDLEFVIEYFGGLPNGKEIELEVLPVEEEELQARLKRLKVEIMSGGGPDVFILSSDMPDPEASSNQPRLFPNLEKTITQKVFFPLDEYIAKAQHMEWAELNQTVMAVGRSEEGQMLLPMFHSINMGIAYTNLDTSVFPASWDEVPDSNSAAKAAYGNALWNGSFRDMIFARCVDYNNETLLISEEELSRRVKEALTINTGIENVARAEWLFTPLVVENHWEGERDETYHETVFPLLNVEGKVTSHVDSYIAINRNTPYPDEAFALVDMLMSKEFLTLEAFWNQERMDKKSGIFLFCELPIWGGMPVYDSLLEDGCLMQRHQYMPESRWPVYEEALSNLSVYLPSAIDNEIQSLFLACRQANSEEIDKLVSKSYSSIKMMLAES